jgi:hypothetical protein
MGKQHKQAAARGGLVGQRRIADNGLSLNWEVRRLGEVRGDANANADADADADTDARCRSTECAL